MKGYARRVRLVLTFALLLNAGIALAKILVGWRANSLSVIGDGLHSGVDAAANAVAILVLRFAEAPPDADHPFGHSKFETLAAFILAAMLVLTAFELGRAAVGRLLAPQATTVTTLTLVVMVATLFVNLVVTLVETRQGRLHGSQILLADAAQSRADAFVTLGVLGGLALDRVGFARADALLALAVAFFIAFAAYSVFRSALPVLTDRAMYDPADVARVVREVPGVRSVHDIRSRGGPRESFVQMHLVVDPTDVEGAHAVADEVERLVSERLGVKEVFVHVEPEDDRSGPPGSAG
jgi:cation diffusion facilitator family transporter